MIGRQITGQCGQIRAAHLPPRSAQRSAQPPICRSAQHSRRHAARASTARAASASYSTAPASNFASLDSLELDRLHSQLRSAYSWLDISASIADFGGIMVDEESVVAALVRLSAIYSHLGESDQAEVRASGLVERLAAMAQRRLPALTPQQLADTLDALARLEFRAPSKFLQAADRQAQASISDFAPAQLPLLLCAFAALGQEPGAALLNAIGEALAHQDLQVAPADVSRMLVALAGLTTRPSTLVLKGLASALRRQLDSFRPAELSQALSALAKLKFHPGKDVVARVAARAGFRNGARPAMASRAAGAAN
jgi:hypothetical protein